MVETMEELRAGALGCTACRLAQTRTNVVFGVGSETAKVMFVGEGPGQNEDLQGEPFVGRAGQLLDRLLVASGFSRAENVYIANMVKCRPPGNRDPEKDEVASCIGYLHRQIELINPRIIVCLGRIAAQAMISPQFRVTREHGQFVEKDGRLMTATFHPAALLRYPDNKPDSFADFLAVRDKLAELED